LRQAAAPYPAETPSGCPPGLLLRRAKSASARQVCFGAHARHLRRYCAKSPSPAAAMAKCAVFSYLSAHVPAAFWPTGGYLAPANKAFTSGVRML